MAKSKKPAARAKPPTGQPGLYELEVAIISGLITEGFAKANPYILRTIQIRGDQTLKQLHEVIFKAFDRFDAHMYEFQIGGKRPMDPKGRRYVLRPEGGAGFADDYGANAAGDVRTTTIASLGLKKNDRFAYWFDFGDDWWHQINVLAIHEKVPSGKYPKITARTGESPPQYPDFDDEDDGDDDDDDDDDD
jgi:hypothetical protein